jgi:hypothetical protein
MCSVEMFRGPEEYLLRIAEKNGFRDVMEIFIENYKNSKNKTEYVAENSDRSF